MEGLIFLLGSLVLLAGAVVMAVSMWLGIRVLLRRVGARTGLEVASLAELSALEARVAEVEQRQRQPGAELPDTGERTPPEPVPLG